MCNVRLGGGRSDLYTVCVEEMIRAIWSRCSGMWKPGDKDGGHFLRPTFRVVCFAAETQTERT